MKRFLSVFLSCLFFCMLYSCNMKDEGNVNYKLIISCDEIVANFDSEAYAISTEKRDIVPEDGYIFNGDVKCNEGDNVFDAVVNELKTEKIHFDGADGYFKGISNIYAGDCGEFSGWMFFVNGNLAELGASDTIINENDVIEFKYIVDYNSLF